MLTPLRVLEIFRKMSDEVCGFVWSLVGCCFNCHLTTGINYEICKKISFVSCSPICRSFLLIAQHVKFESVKTLNFICELQLAPVLWRHLPPPLYFLLLFFLNVNSANSSLSDTLG